MQTGAKANIYYCRYDFFAAIIIANYVYFNLGVAVTFISVKSPETIQTEISKKADYHFVLGAPDTPEGIGEYLSSIEPDLTKLYQLRMGENFCLSVVRTAKKGKIVILAGSGLGGVIEAWLHFLKDNESDLQGVPNVLEQVFGSTILMSIMQKASGKVGTVLAEKIFSRIENSLEDEAMTGVEGEKEMLRDEMKDLQTVVGSTDADVLTVLEETLNLHNKSPLMKFAISEGFQNSNVPEVLRGVMEELEEAEVAVESLKSLAEILVESVFLVARLSALTSKQKLMVKRYLDGFRGLLQNTEDLLQEFDATMQLDQKALIDISGRMYGSANNYTNWLCEIDGLKAETKADSKN
jgi:hypothetical protein